MADVTETVVYRAKLGSIGIRYLVCEAQPIDTNDIVTLGELNAITSAKAWRTDTGANITCTTATNVVTITESSLTDVPIVILATGY